MSFWSHPLVLVAGVSAGVVALVGCTSTTIDPSPPSTSTATDDRPLLVCQGLADIEGGVSLLRPEASGRVTTIGFRQGDRVKSGDILLRTDDSVARREVAAARAKRNAAQGALAQAEQEARQHPTRLRQRRASLTETEARLAGAKVALKRQEDLVDKRLASPSEAEVARERVRELEASTRAARELASELEATNAQLAVTTASAQRDAAMARLELAEQLLLQHTLRAPSAGTLLSLGLHVGEIAGPGADGAIEFCPEGEWLVRAEVEQEFALQLATGQRARITDEMAGRGPWTGQVDRIGGAYQRRRTRLDPTSFKDVPTLQCLIRLDPGHPLLRVGQRLRVSIYPTTQSP